MKKYLVLALVCAFTWVSNSSATVAVSEKQIAKEVKKEVKALKKEGWKVLPGSLPFERQMTDVYLKLYDRDEVGRTNFIIGTSQAVGQNIDAARIQAQSLCKFDIVQQTSTQLTGLIEENVANKQLSPNEAVSISDALAKSKELISGKLGRTIPLLECYKQLPNGNVQLLIRVGYSSDDAITKAKEIIREQMGEELKDLGKKLDLLTK
jgi:hypothetical protein